MKVILSIALALTSLSALAQQRIIKQRNLDREMQVCERECSNHCSRFVNRLSRRLDNMAYNCGYDQPAPMPPVRQQVKFYKNDSCHSSYLGSVVNPRDCHNFAQNVSGSVWAVEIDGNCLNIDDTSALNACRAFTNARYGRAVELYRNDSCHSSIVGLIDYNTNCSEFAQSVSSSIWGIKVNGECINIPDTNAERACNLYKNEM